MLHLDQHLDELNPEYLYVHAVRPVAAVTGAINGSNGPKDPRWFCQLGFSGFRRFASADEAKKFLQQTRLNLRHPLLSLTGRRMSGCLTIPCRD